jgi:hypothetical protein
MRPLVLGALFLAACGPSEVEPDDMSTTDSALTGDVPIGSTLKTTGNVNFRSGPDTTYAVLSVATTGTLVTTVNTTSPSGRFYNVQLNGQTGWISGVYLQLVKGPATTMGPGMGNAYPLRLTNGAFAPVGSHPNAIVYVPANFNGTPPIDVVVWIHGFYNCVENVIRDTNAPCQSGGASRDAYQLVSQLEASNKNALLLVPEVAFDQASSASGKLSNTNGFKNLLNEALADMNAELGAVTTANVGTVVVASHSGGYAAAAGILNSGGVPVEEVWLFDSLYGYESSYESWVYDDVAGLEAGQRRFASVYTFTGGTDANSKDMASSVKTQVAASAIHDDRGTSTWAPADYHYGLLFKQSALAHNDVPRYYFEQLLETSMLHNR